MLVILVILLKRTTAETREKMREKPAEKGLATLQKRLFGKTNKEDPLPVVLLSYKADYDEMLPGFK